MEKSVPTLCCALVHRASVFVFSILANGFVQGESPRIYPAMVATLPTEAGHFYQLDRSLDLAVWEHDGAAFLSAGQTLVRAHEQGEDDAFYYRMEEVSGEWVQVWGDEFEGEEIDSAKWAFDVNANGGGNNELQYYTDERRNAFVSEGRLVIRAVNEPYSGIEGSRDYSSAKLTSKFRGAWKYGRIEARAKLPIGQGVWPAIWMLPMPNEYGGWASSGEIDIVELVGHEPDTVHGTLHYGGRWPNNVSSGDSFELESGTFNDDFHVFALEWEEGEIRWYVDGELYQTQNEWHSTSAAYPAPYDKPFYLILNVAVGGNWPGNPDATTPFPAEMEVDYVRVFQWAE